MLSGLSDAVTKVLGGGRFSLVGVVPVVVLTGYVATVAASGAYGGGDADISALIEKLGRSPGWAVASAGGIFLVAVLLRPFQVSLVQMLEGYWRGRAVLQLAAGLAVERHRRRLDTAQVVHMSTVPPRSATTAAFADVVTYARRKRRVDQATARAGRTMESYPSPVRGAGSAGRADGADGVDDRLMPTMLGNVLRDGEDRSGRRYGLDLPAVAPRLYPYLSSKLDLAIGQQLDLLDTTSALCVSFGLATAAGCPLVVRLDSWSLAPLVTLVLAMAAYKGALRVAAGHAELLATAFDLHRFDMLAGLHLKLPRNPEEEYESNVRLSGFLASKGRPAKEMLRGVAYAHPDDAERPPLGGSGSGPGDGDGTA